MDKNKEAYLRKSMFLAKKDIIPQIDQCQSVQSLGCSLLPPLTTTISQLHEQKREIIYTNYTISNTSENFNPHNKFKRINFKTSESLPMKSSNHNQILSTQSNKNKAKILKPTLKSIAQDCLVYRPSKLTKQLNTNCDDDDYQQLFQNLEDQQTQKDSILNQQKMMRTQSDLISINEFKAQYLKNKRATKNPSRHLPLPIYTNQTNRLLNKYRQNLLKTQKFTQQIDLEAAHPELKLKQKSIDKEQFHFKLDIEFLNEDKISDVQKEKSLQLLEDSILDLNKNKNQNVLQNIALLEENTKQEQRDKVQGYISKILEGPTVKDLHPQKKDKYIAPPQVENQVQGSNYKTILIQKPKLTEKDIKQKEQKVELIFKTLKIPRKRRNLKSMSKEEKFKHFSHALIRAVNQLRESKLEVSEVCINSGKIFGKKPFSRQNTSEFIKQIKNGNYDLCMKQLKKDRYMVFDFDHISMTPLHHACKAGSFEIAQLLLNNGANININDLGGRSPLYFAMQSKNVNLVILLLQNKACPFNTEKIQYEEFFKDTPILQKYIEKARDIFKQVRRAPKEKDSIWKKAIEEGLEIYT